jgi:putative long chain acyl-CoA synthase
VTQRRRERAAEQSGLRSRRARSSRSERARIRLGIAKARKSAANALEVMRLGRLTARRDAPYAVVHQDRHYRLRRYGDVAGGPVLLLVPPLMLTAEIYDVAPELSAVTTLAHAGIDPWVVDFGAPEHEEGGMSRTLDDHVRAVSDAVSFVRNATGRPVHIAGYSQGGMFAYQAAAYRRSEDIASVITFGSPVDIHKNLPKMSNDVTARIIQAARPVVEASLERIEGLPGVITSTAFKLLSVRREVEQLIDFLRLLHDRQALERRESRRRFLGGEGFVAWPGPALRQFVDEFVVHNRMLSGGFVVGGRAVTLADIHCPVLYFVDNRDELARGPSVRAIVNAAPDAETFEVTLPAGHFGLVVGRTANEETWPTVIEWLRWREGLSPRPHRLSDAESDRENEGGAEPAHAAGLLYDVASTLIGAAWDKLGEAFVDAEEALDALRYQVPRLTRLRLLRSETRVSVGRSLADQARAIPERTFFLWHGRAFSYADADGRVDAIVRGLVSRGVRAGHRVGVLMEGRPTYLCLVTALNRLGAIAVLMSPRLEPALLERAVEVEPLEYVVADRENASRGREAFGGEVFVLGSSDPTRAQPLPPNVVDLEAIDPNAIELPDTYEPNAGRASDVALILVMKHGADSVRAVRVTNRRWALSAFGAAAACTLTSIDTVYCCMPLHHPAGLLVAVGAGLVAGARLALATRFEASVFWTEVRSYGATVAFYAGEMCRELVNAPSTPAERRSPLRLFAGSGLRTDVWRRLVDRSGVGVLEFYASTEATVVLANAAGTKIGSIGRPLPGSSDIALVAWDRETGELVRDPPDFGAQTAQGFARRAATNEVGLLLARLDEMPAEASSSPSRVARDVFVVGDAWWVTNDLLRCDDDGDYWFFDRRSDMIPTDRGLISPRRIEDTVLAAPEVAFAAVYGVRLPGSSADVAALALVLRGGASLDRAALFRAIAARHPIEERPRFVRVVASIPMTEGFRAQKHELAAEGIGPGTHALVYDAAREAYVDPREHAKA